MCFLKKKYNGKKKKKKGKIGQQNNTQKTKEKHER
jgi:hypothetical protein